MSDLELRFDEACTYAADVLEDLVKDGKFDFPDYTLADALAGFSGSISNNPQGEYVLIGGIDVLLVQLAETDERFFDLCSHICSTNIILGAQLPSTLRVFVSRILLQEQARPKIPHREKTKNWLEKSVLWTLTNELVETFGLVLTRNDEPAIDSKKRSACDAVVVALRLCGRETIYLEIKNLMVHPDAAALRAEFRAVAEIYHRSNDQYAPLNALSPHFEQAAASLARSDVRTLADFLKVEAK